MDSVSEILIMSPPVLYIVMSRRVTAGHISMRQSEHNNDSFKKEKEILNKKYGEPCPECKVRIEREELDGLGNVEYPKGCHAIGCSLASQGSYHPKDARAN